MLVIVDARSMAAISAAHAHAQSYLWLSTWHIPIPVLSTCLPEWLVKLLLVLHVEIFVEESWALSYKRGWLSLTAFSQVLLKSLQTYTGKSKASLLFYCDDAHVLTHWPHACTCTSLIIVSSVQLYMHIHNCVWLLLHASFYAGTFVFLFQVELKVTFLSWRWPSTSIHWFISV